MIYIDKSDTPHFWEIFRQQHPQVRIEKTVQMMYC